MHFSKLSMIFGAFQVRCLRRPATKRVNGRASGGGSVDRKLDHQQKPLGFSMTELLITMAVFAILVSAATPTFLNFVNNSRVEQEAQDLFAVINQTRQSAILSGRRAYLCRAVDVPNPECRTQNGVRDWSGKMLMYSMPANMLNTAPNGDFVNQGIQTLGAALTADQRLQAVLATTDLSHQIMAINSNRTDNVIVFNGQGQLVNQAPFHIAVCDNRANPEQYGQLITVSQAGRLRIGSLQDTGGNNKAVDCNGV